LDEIEGKTPPVKFPIILGHQIVRRVEKAKRKGRVKEGQASTFHFSSLNLLRCDAFAEAVQKR